MASRASLEESQRRLTLGGAGRYIRSRVLEPTFTADTTAVVLPPVPTSHKNRPGGVRWTEVVDKMQPRGWVCGDLKSSERTGKDVQQTQKRLAFDWALVGWGLALDRTALAPCTCLRATLGTVCFVPGRNRNRKRKTPVGDLAVCGTNMPVEV